MNIFALINAFFMLAGPVSNDANIEKVDFRVRTYSYGSYYPEPYVCPHGYTYGPGYTYRRGFRFYAPGYFGAYRYGCYDNQGRLYRPRAYYRDRYYPRYYYYRHR